MGVIVDLLYAALLPDSLSDQSKLSPFYSNCYSSNLICFHAPLRFLLFPLFVEFTFHG